MLPPDKTFPEAHWDCSGEFLLKSRNWLNRFSFDLDGIGSMHIVTLVYTTLLHFMHLLATFLNLSDFRIFPDWGMASLVYIYKYLCTYTDQQYTDVVLHL